MAWLRWLLHSAYLIVVGQQPQEEKKKDDEETETTAYSEEAEKKKKKKESGSGFFQMPVHYPRYSKQEYEEMEEWKVDMLLNQYGLVTFHGGSTLSEKRAFAIATFLWPDQLY